ncbi:MAG: hypothetical protein SNJ69_08175 [Chloroflexaceae bacterium]
MSTRWEYKVAFVERWERVSVEGHETRPEKGERRSAFGRRFLNTLGADGWELSGVQHTMPGRVYLIFKRPLEGSAEPDLSVARHEQAVQSEGQPTQPLQPPEAGSGPQVVTL